MNEIIFDNSIISLFIHKPYNFNYNELSKTEIDNEYDKLGIEFKKIIRPNQNHTNIVKVVDESNIDDSFDDVDGLITDLKGIALVITVADCQGVLLYDSVKGVIGNIHSGWKGTLNRIGSNAIKLMIDKYNSNPKDIKIYISPSIHKCHFEVGEDVKDLFIKEFTDIDISGLITSKDNNKYYLDTVELNKRVFTNLGIKKENIYSSDLCSVCNEEIHSYRRDKPNDGRNIILIEKKETIN